MSIESESAEQIVNMSLKGAEVGARVAASAVAGSSKMIVAMLMVIARKVKEGKELSPGEKSLHKLMKDGDQVHIFTVSKDALPYIKDAMKEYGVPYTAVYDKHDDTLDIVVKERDASRAARAIEKRLGDFTEMALDEEELLDDDNLLDADNGESLADIGSLLDDSRGKECVGQYICCVPEHPETRFEATTTEKTYDGRVCYETEYTLYTDERVQKCDYFKHGKFISRTDASGHSTSESGQNHWFNMRTEMLQKLNLNENDSVLIFDSKEDFEEYQKSCQEAQIASNQRGLVDDVIVGSADENPARAQTEEIAAPSEQSSLLRHQEAGRTNNDEPKKESVRAKLERYDKVASEAWAAKVAERGFTQATGRDVTQELNK